MGRARIGVPGESASLAPVGVRRGSISSVTAVENGTSR
jgi:hypothetical protein